MTVVPKQTQQNYNAVLEGNQEIVEQALAMLSALNEAQYSFLDSPRFQSSIGQHMRHVLDLHHALIEGMSDRYIDFDIRRRGHDVEHIKSVAQDEWQTISDWLDTLDDEMCRTKVTVKTEVSLGRQASAEAGSTLERELIFVASHAVHHFALMRLAAYQLGVMLPHGFGVAAATASYLRGSA